MTSSVLYSQGARALQDARTNDSWGESETLVPGGVNGLVVHVHVKQVNSRVAHPAGPAALRPRFVRFSMCLRAICFGCNYEILADCKAHHLSPFAGTKNMNNIIFSRAHYLYSMDRAAVMRAPRATVIQCSCV